MSGSVRDLEHCFVINGRVFNVHIVSGDLTPRPTLVSNNDFDVTIFTCPLEELADFDCDEPHKVALQVVERVSAFLPAQPSSETLNEFQEAVLDWIMRHRITAALAAHED